MNEDTNPEKNPEDKLQEGKTPQESTQDGEQDNPIKEYAITDRTEMHYSKIVKGLWDYSERKKSSTDLEQVSPDDLVKDLSERNNLNQNTTLTYAYALRWFFGKNNSIKEFAEALVKLDQLIDEVRANAPNQGTRDNKRPKAGNSIPKDDLEMLISELTERSSSGSSIWAAPAQRWLLAGLATGLRPGEWLTADWVDEGKTAVRLTTSKVKAAPPGFMRDSMGDKEYVPAIKTRDIPIALESERFDVDIHIKTIKAYVLSGKMSFKQFHDNCGRLIALSCKTLWGNKKTYTLNSGRKQFSANMRAAVGKVRTATLMGHTKPNTPAANFYGKASQAYSRTGKNYRKNTQKENQVDGMQYVEPQPGANQSGESPDADTAS